MAFRSSDKVGDIITFASDLKHRLFSSNLIQCAQFADVSLYLDALPLLRSRLTIPQRNVLRKTAIEIWNLCNSLDATTTDPSAEKSIAHIRAFAYFAFSSVFKLAEDVEDCYLELFKCCMRSARSSLQCSEVNLAYKILSNEAGTREYLAKLSNDDAIQESAQYALAKYDCLRVAVEWKRGRMDLAEHLYHNRHNRVFASNAYCAELLIDLTYQIGLEELEQNRHDTAVRWLHKARSLLADGVPDSLGLDISEMESNVSHAYEARALLNSQDSKKALVARQIASQMRREHGDTLAILLLQLEVHKKSGDADIKLFSSDLKASIRSIQLLDTNHQLILHYLYELHKLNALEALSCLCFYVTHRLGPQGNQEWVEASVVSYIWLLTEALGNFGISSMNHSFDDLSAIQESCRAPIRERCIDACHAVLWHFVETNNHEESISSTIFCCQIGLHNLLRDCFDENLGKFERRLVTCYLATSDVAAAQSVLSNMPPNRKHHKLTRFLAYKVALRAGHDEDVQLALGAFNQLNEHDKDLIFCYATESLKHQDCLEGARVLQRILDKGIFNVAPGVRAGTLVRYTAYLLIQVLSEDELESSRHDEALARLCGVFKMAVTLSPNHENASVAKLAADECQQLSALSYDTAVHHLRTWPAKYVIDLLVYSSQLVYAAKSDGSNSETTNYDLHEVDIALMLAALYIHEARRENAASNLDDLRKTALSNSAKPLPTEITFVLCQNAFKQFSRVQRLLSEQGVEEPCSDELHRKLHAIIPLAFEALLSMSKFSYSNGNHHAFNDLNLTTLVDFALQVQAQIKVFTRLVDLMLSSYEQLNKSSGTDDPSLDGAPPISLVVKFLLKIVQAPCHRQARHSKEVARWIRCTSQLLLRNIGDTISCRGKGNEPSPKYVENLCLLQSLVEESLSLAHAALEVGQCRSTHANNNGDEISMHNSGLDAPNKGEPSILNQGTTEELEWMAISIFNMALDMYIVGDEASAKPWIQRALQLADMTLLYNKQSPDDDVNSADEYNSLARTMRCRMRQLGWTL